MMHLKVIRVFVESVLRYGIGERGTPSFKALIIHPKVTASFLISDNDANLSARGSRWSA